MKKNLLLIITSIIIFSLVGCTTTVPQEPENIPPEESNNLLEEEVLTVLDYYPFKENTVMDYQGIGNEFAEQKTFIEFVEGNRAQMKIINPGTTFVRVLEYKDGSLTEVFAEGEFYHIENMLDATSNSENIILQEPLKVGNTWEDSEGHNVEITSINQSIETPSGTYEALEITKKLEEGSTEKRYYAKDIGHVATIYLDGEFEVKTLLEEIDDEYEMEVITYYPTAQDVGTEYVKQDIEFNTNDNIEEILEDIMKNPPSNKLVSPISKNTKINKLHLNRDSWTLEADFSKELLTEMNAGSSFETEILKSITNTLGVFYDVDKVYITLEGEPYASGHYGISEGEYFEVDLEGINELEE